MEISSKNREKLIDNIVDQVKEAEIKLGYSKGTVRLYYPAESLAGLVGQLPMAADALAKGLEGSGAFADTPLGGLRFSVKQGRIEVSVPPEGVEAVHETVPEPPFLRALIEFFRAHHRSSLEEIRALFGRFSPDYACEKMPEGGDFQYVLYFPGGAVDPYYYCITDEMGHMTYHRFTKEDYLAMMEA